jgi:hypothetical protein
MQYVLQRRHDEGRIKTRPAVARQVAAFLAGSGAGSLLDLIRPGIDGGSDSWRGWSHVSPTQVPSRAS